MNEIINQIFAMRTAAWKRFGPLGEAPMLYLGRKQMQEIRELPVSDQLAYVERTMRGQSSFLGMEVCEVHRDDHLALGLPQS